MDWNYTGTYKAKGDGYVLEITGGQSSVSDLLAKEKNDAYKITVEPNDDGTLTVYLNKERIYLLRRSVRHLLAKNIKNKH